MFDYVELSSSTFGGSGEYEGVLGQVLISIINSSETKHVGFL